MQPPPHSLRSKRSIADESGGEEILYPRHPILPLGKAAQAAGRELSPAVQKTSSGEAAGPPSAFVSPDRQRPRKRTSDEFEMDYNTGIVSSKHTSPSSVSIKDKEKVRRHRSLGPGVSSSIGSSSKPSDAQRETLSAGVRHQRQVILLFFI